MPMTKRGTGAEIVSSKNRWRERKRGGKIVKENYFGGRPGGGVSSGGRQSRIEKAREDFGGNIASEDKNLQKEVIN